jgi:hypothetical protein
MLIELEVLKFLGLGVGLASTLWGLLRNPTLTDEAGNKRLTPAGHVSIALAITGFLVSASSQGFQILLEARKRDAANIAALTEASRRAADEARAARTEQAAQRIIDLQALSEINSKLRAAEQRAILVGQSLLSIRLADEARSRDLVIARDVNVGSRRNLRRAEETLGQLARVLHPLRDVCLEVWWELPGTTPGLSAATQRIEQQAVRLDPVVASIPGLIPLPGAPIVVTPDSDLYPQPEREAEAVLYSALRFPRAQVAFVADGKDVPRLLASSIGGLEFWHQTADLAFDMSWESERSEESWGSIRNVEEPPKYSADLFFDPDDRSVSFALNRSRIVSDSPTGKIISIPDIESSTMAISINNVLSDYMKPHVSWLRVGARTYRSGVSNDQLKFSRKKFRDRHVWIAKGLSLSPDDGTVPQCKKSL